MIVSAQRCFLAPTIQEVASMQQIALMECTPRTMNLATSTLYKNVARLALPVEEPDVMPKIGHTDPRILWHYDYRTKSAACAARATFDKPSD